MNCQIRYTKIESSPALTSYIEAKLVDTLKKLRGAGQESRWQILIEVGKETERHRKGEVWFAEVSGSTSYGQLRVQSEASAIYEAIDLAQEELKSTLTKSKGKIFSKSFRAARRLKNAFRLSRLARLFRRGRIRDEI